MSGDLLAFMVNLIHNKDMSLGRNFVVLNSAATLHGYVLENFNEITCQSQKSGGRPRPHSQMQPFQDILDECGFMDLGFVGFPFTWHKHFEDYTIWELLDRTMATNDWFSMFPGTKVYHLDVTTSNHKPLLIAPKSINNCFQKPFRFEQMWLMEKGCTETVETVWCENSMDPEDSKVIKKIDKCGVALSQWSKKNFGSVRNDLEQKRKELCKAKTWALHTRDSNA